MDRFENMRVFGRVVETGSISAAADRLGVAKSAVSRRLKALEAYLGVELFHRSTRQMTLTETGRAFYQRTLRILEDLEEAEQATTRAHTTLKGRIKVALPTSFGLMHMSAVINDFLQAHPQIEFELDFNDREVDLIREGFDLAIRIADLPDSSLIARKLAPVDFVLCASPAYLEEHGMPDTPQQLPQHRCLVYSLGREPEAWHLIDRQGGMSSVKIRPTLVSSAGEFLRDAAVAGQGIILMPVFIVYRELELGQLQAILTQYRFPVLNAWAIYPQTRHLSQRVRAFVDFLQQRYAGEPYWNRCLNRR